MSGADPFQSHDPFGGALPERCGRVRIARHGALAGCGDACEALISAEERQAASRLSASALRLGRIAHYAARRRILADLTGSNAQELPITHNTDGAPELGGSRAPPISISRSGEWTCIAVGSSGRAGVDIEQVRPLNWRPMLGMLSTGTEAAAWAGFLEWHDDPDKAFLWLWTAKEAVLKAHGIGLRAGPKLVVLHPQDFTAGLGVFRVRAFGQIFDVWMAEGEGIVVSYAAAPDAIA